MQHDSTNRAQRTNKPAPVIIDHDGTPRQRKAKAQQGSSSRRWTQEQIDDFTEWHEKRLKELNYPKEVEKEFREARGRWMPRLLEE